MKRACARWVVGPACILLLAAAACSREIPKFDANTNVGVTTPKVKFEPVFKFKTECKDYFGVKAAQEHYKIECGELTVLEDRDKIKGAKVTLSALMIRSPNPNKKPDPVIYLEGGPGGAALVAVSEWTKVGAPLLADRDIILVDQRGTGYSSANFSCTMERVRARSFDDIPNQMTKCYQRLGEGKFDLSKYMTSDAATDVHDLITALNLKEVNLFGVSYGTRLAMQIMRDHPEGIRSVVLDSTYPLGTLGWNELAVNGSRAFDAIFDACAADPECGPKYGDLRATLSDVITNLDAHPIIVPVMTKTEKFDYQFKGADFVNELFHLAYSAKAVRAFPKGLQLSKDSPERGLSYIERAAASEGAEQAPEDMRRQPETFSSGLFFVIQCAEEAPFTTLDAATQAAAAVPEPLRSSLMVSTAKQFEICKTWNLEPRKAEPLKSSIPTLVLAGSFDPITPPAWGQLAASQIAGSKFMLVEGSGHGVFFVGQCEADAVASFVNDPAAPGNPSCPPITEFI